MCLLQTTISNDIHWTSVLRGSVIRTWSPDHSVTWWEVQTRWWILEYSEPVIFFPKYTQVKICHGKNIYTMFTTLLITPPPTHCVWVTKWAITYTMEQHPAIKSREVLAHATTEWTCRTQCLVKAASHKCQHTTWFHFLQVSRMDQSTAWKATSAVYSCVA